MATHVRGYYLRLYELVTQSGIPVLKRGCIWLHSQLKRLLIRVTRAYQLRRRCKLLLLLVTELLVKLRLVLL